MQKREILNKLDDFKNHACGIMSDGYGTHECCDTPEYKEHKADCNRIELVELLKIIIDSYFEEIYNG